MRLLRPRLLEWVDRLGLHTQNERFAVGFPILLFSIYLGAWCMGRILVFLGVLSHEEGKGFPFVSRRTT